MPLDDALAPDQVMRTDRLFFICAIR